jgi:hypothetical protein
VALERLHHPGEVQERAAQPVHLVDDHAIDLALGDVGQQAPQRRPVHVAAGEAAVVVAVGQADPPLVLLAGDEGLGRLALGVQRDEFLLQAFFGRFARVDGAAYKRQGAEGLCRVFVHADYSWLFRAPRKNK